MLTAVGVPALAFVLVRAAGFLGGARIATRLAGAPEVVQRWVGFGLLPQAGLALALSMLFARTFPEFGAEAGAMMLGVVALNELVAPVLYRWALVKSGEAGMLESADEASAEAPSGVPVLVSDPVTMIPPDPRAAELAQSAIASAWTTGSTAPLLLLPDAPPMPPVPPPRRSTEPSLPANTVAAPQRTGTWPPDDASMA